MSDAFGETPIRSQLPGQVLPDDVIVKLGDATNPTTQQAKVDTNGSQYTVIADVSGNDVTTQANGAQRALDVGIDVAGVQIDPRQIRALTSADVVTAQQGTSPWIATATLTEDHNWGTVGANTLRTAAEIGNAAGAADFNFGAVGAQTLRVAAEVANATGLLDDNFGAVGAQTLRTAAQVGNSTGAADFNNGVTGAQTLRVAANLAIGGSNVSLSNPIPVTTIDAFGTSVDSYQTSVSLASGASVNFDYTVTAAKTWYGQQLWATAGLLIKAELQFETAPASGVFNNFWVAFNSVASPNILIPLPPSKTQVAGAKIRVKITNEDKKATDVYETLSGTEQ